MAKLTLQTLTSLANTVTALSQMNANNAAIIAAIENTLSRNGTTPNEMESDLDLNGNDILNANLTETDRLILNGTEVTAETSLTIVNDVAEVASISALRAATSATLTQTTALVLGWYANSPHGGGVFVYDSGDAVSADDGGIVIVDASGRRWKRRDTSPLTPTMFGARGDGTTDDTTALQTALTAIETGTYSTVLDLQGLNYGISDELVLNSGDNRTIRGGILTALTSANWDTYYTTTDITDLLRINSALYSRDLTNAAWTKTSATVALSQTGIDGTSNSATLLTATGANGRALQSITAASTTWVLSAFVKRSVGTGNVEMTMDNGATWTAVTIDSSGFKQVSIPPQTLANPTIGIRCVTSGDAIIVDGFQLEAIDTATGIPIVTPPLFTTSTAVTRQIRNTYMLRLESTAQSALVFDVGFECGLKTGGIFCSAFNSRIVNCRIDGVAGVGIKQETGGMFVTGNLISGNFAPAGRVGIGIFSAQADGKFVQNICRYLAAPVYLGPSELGSENGSTGLWVANHAYNGHSTYNPDAIMIYAGSGANSNIFVGGYLDNGRIIIRNNDIGFWSNRVAWGNVNCSALFNFWTSTASQTLGNFLFKGLEYPRTTLSASNTQVFDFLTTGSGSWALNTTVIEGLNGYAEFSAQTPAVVSNGTVMQRLLGNATTSYLTLLGLTSTNGVRIGVEGEDLIFETNDVERVRIGSTGLVEMEYTGAGGLVRRNPGASGIADMYLEGSRTTDVAYAELRAQNRAAAAPAAAAGEAAIKFLRDGANDTTKAVIELDISGSNTDVAQFTQHGLQGRWRTSYLTGNANFTLTVGGNKTQVVHAGTLTADRTITLSTTDAFDGASFRITRTGAGAFNLSVGGLKNLVTNSWCEVVYDGPNATWRLAAYGTL